MSIEDKTYEGYLPKNDKKRLTIECLIAGLTVGFSTKMFLHASYNGPGPGAIIPIIMTINNREKKTMAYAKNLISYSIGSFIGYAASDAIYLLATR